ncbi:hypothetical protein KM176_11530 [Pseudooceanicola sp. CBS1P-1]|uniref:AlpA family phage regulatory protein n=1 Tax=Pseudooceanicola albus TaxID=2692189 RepID=A0A6L7G9G6_9RHOB|nr:MULTISPECIES: hypothetical protein [Pseudooceanicola]MBT9384491.1 hypothetical protein [Pseudooceanicola endophyticus]MXN20609.1 hypothetical protein [Pseudooceanicola albus]
MADHSLTAEAACGSSKWAAQFLGLSPGAFSDRRRTLEAKGFPQPDPLLKLYIKADVMAWLETRRRIRDGDKMPEDGERPRLNLGAL